VAQEKEKAMTSIPTKDHLFQKAQTSALQKRFGLLDFDTLQNQSLADAAAVAVMYGVDQSLGRGFVAGEFAKMKLNILDDIAADVINDVANARIKAEDVTGKYRRGLEELTGDVGPLFETLRERLPTQPIDTAEFPGVKGDRDNKTLKSVA
jgi:hypothetical protein